MPVELRVPSVGESISAVEIGDWLKAEGQWVNKDENLVMLESEKATVELPSAVAGTLARIVKRKGEKAAVGEVIGYLDPAAKPKEEGKPEAQGAEEVPRPGRPSAPKKPREKARVEAKTRVVPPAQRLAEEEVEPSQPLPGEEAIRHVVKMAERKAEAPQAVRTVGVSEREEEAVPMSPLRRAVAQHLLEAQQSMAILTTFNEIDMTTVLALRKETQESFQQKHGAKLGLMSFFVKAAVDALKMVPHVNASISGNNIVYHNYFDIGIAIGSDKGLVVPVLRNAERMSFAEVEKAIGDFSARAKENKLLPDELHGGTFTITNGGIYGSLLSTPIINPPQSGILGMHAIQERPMAIAGQVVIRPMMFVALSYDHRIIDGRQAVTFLRRIKEVIENPARMLLDEA
jgi:2-oxoglutarate dehydrogenase E2 component (dihydrolipoamide succinyltransferase)